MSSTINNDIQFIDAQFKSFVDFAKTAEADTKVRTAIGPEGGLHTIAAKTESVFSKVIRSASNKNVNNAARAVFRESIARMFGGEDHIPASVKSAMRIGDFGKGKPLTARRILAVQSAIEQIAAKHDSLLREGLESHGAQHGGQAAGRVKLAFASCHGNPDAMEIVAEKLGSILNDGGGNLRSEETVKKRVEGLVDNLAELKSLSRKNPAVYAEGKALLLGLGKPLPKGMVSRLVQAANQAPLGQLRRLSGDSTGLAIHQAVRQFQDILMSALESSGAAKELEGEQNDLNQACHFVGGVILSRCSAKSLENIRDALNGDATAHLDRFYERCSDKELDDLPLDVELTAETMDVFRAAGDIAHTYLETLGSCVARNLERVAPDAPQVEFKGYDQIPDLEHLGGSDLVDDALSMGKEICAKKVESYVSGRVDGSGQAADECKRLIRNKLGVSYDPNAKLGDRLAANANAMMNVNICGEMKKIATGAECQFKKDIYRSAAMVLKDGNRTINVAREFEAARNDLARFVTGDDSAQYATLQPAARNKVHLLMSMISQETEKVGENGTATVMEARESSVGYVLSNSHAQAQATRRTYTVTKNADGGFFLQYEMDKPINGFRPNDTDEDIDLGEGSSFKCELKYKLTGAEVDRIASLDFSAYDDAPAFEAINVMVEQPDGKMDYRDNSLIAAQDAIGGDFRISAEAQLRFDFKLNTAD